MISREHRSHGTWKDGGKETISIDEAHVVPPGLFHGNEVGDWQEVNDLLRDIAERRKRVTLVSAGTSAGVINAPVDSDLGTGIEGVDFSFDGNMQRVHDLLNVELAEDGVTPEYVWTTGPSPIRSVNIGLRERFRELSRATGMIYQVDFDVTTGDGSALGANIVCRAKGDKRTTVPVEELIWSRGGKTAEKITDPRMIRAIMSTNGLGGAVLAQKLKVSPMLPHESLLIVSLDETDPQRFHGVASGFLQSRLLPWIIAGNLGHQGVSIDYAEIMHRSGLQNAIEVSRMLDASGKGQTAIDSGWFMSQFLGSAAGSLVLGVRHGIDFDPQNEGGFFGDVLRMMEEGSDRGIQFSDIHFIDSRDRESDIGRVHSARKAVPYEARRRNEALKLTGMEAEDTISYDTDFGVLVDPARVCDPDYQDQCAQRWEGLTLPYSEGRARMAEELDSIDIDNGHGLAYFSRAGFDPDKRGLSDRHDRHFVKKGGKDRLREIMEEVESKVGEKAFDSRGPVEAYQDRLGEKSYPNDGPAWQQYVYRRPQAARDTFSLIQMAGPSFYWRMHSSMRRVGEQLLGEGSFDVRENSRKLIPAGLVAAVAK